MPVYRQLLIRLGRYRWFSWVTYTLLVPIDRLLYERSGGRLSLGHVGRRRAGALQTLVLTTRGRNSGEPRSTPLLYLRDGDAHVVVGSNFGRERHPAWTANLLAHPEATIQVRDRRIPVRARRLTEDELRRLWPRLLEVYPAWEAYTHRTDRSFRGFALEPAD